MASDALRVVTNGEADFAAQIVDFEMFTKQSLVRGPRRYLQNVEGVLGLVTNMSSRATGLHTFSRSKAV